METRQLNLLAVQSDFRSTLCYILADLSVSVCVMCVRRGEIRFSSSRRESVSVCV